MKKVKLYPYLIVELVVLGTALTFAHLLASIVVKLLAHQIVRLLVQLIAAMLALDALMIVGLIVKEVVSTAVEVAVDAAGVAVELVVPLAVDVQDALDAVVVQEHAQQAVKNLAGSVPAPVVTRARAVTVVLDAEDHALEVAAVVAEVVGVVAVAALQVVASCVWQVVKLLVRKAALFNAHRSAQITVKIAAQVIA